MPGHSDRRIALKSISRLGTAGLATATLAWLLLALPDRGESAYAHEIPSDVTIQAIVKPDGNRLWLLVRAPLRSMRDVDFPLLGPGYLDIALADEFLRDAAILWLGDNLELYEGDRRLTEGGLVTSRASIPSDRSFGTFEDALAHVTGPRLPDETQLYWEQAMLDALFEYTIESEDARFSIHPRLERLALRVVTVLRFMPPGGAVRAFQYTGDPGLVRLDPRWHQAAFRFVRLGFLHILDGIDHLLFLLCLVIPFRRVRPLVILVTAFTVAHSVTLIASAYGLAPDGLWFPPLVETLIAASIVYLALENIVGAGLHRRWMITLAFGLVHGFGFSFALRDTLQFAGSHMVTSLLSFNVGVELGQLLLVIALVPVLELLFRFVVAERMGTIILSALVGHQAWHWMSDRLGVLSQFQWPALDAGLVALALGWLLVLAVIGGLSWWAIRWLGGRPLAQADAGGVTAGAED